MFWIAGAALPLCRWLFWLVRCVHSMADGKTGEREKRGNGESRQRGETETERPDREGRQRTETENGRRNTEDGKGEREEAV